MRSSTLLTNGDPLLRTREPSYYHDNTEFFILVKEGIFAKVAPLYEKGLSLNEIAAETKIPKTTVRKALIEGGACLRQKENSSHLAKWRAQGKQGSQPPFGFCYFQGEIVLHPKEYKTLLLIRKLWQKGVNSNAIATKLNSQKIPSRTAKEWSWNAVKNIVDRLKNNQLPLKE